MRVLVADDDTVSRLAMEDVLQRCGPFEVMLVADGAAAWRALEGERCFDLVCLDLRMPPPDGLELVARVRASVALRRVPVLLVTAATDRETVLAATASDLQGFLVKPVGDETVLRIGRVLAQLDASVLEPADSAMARLKIDPERHRRYVAAFRQQVAALQALAGDIERADGPAGARALFDQKAGAGRAAALTLGAPRVERVIGDAQEAVRAGERGAAKALGQASYWLERVGRENARPA